MASAKTAGRAALSAAAPISAQGMIPVSMPGMVTLDADIPARISINAGERLKIVSGLMLAAFSPGGR